MNYLIPATVIALPILINLFWCYTIFIRTNIILNMKAHHLHTQHTKCFFRSYNIMKMNMYLSTKVEQMMSWWKSRENKEMHKLISEMVNMWCIQFDIFKLARVSKIDKNGIKLQIDFLLTCGERSVGNQIFVFFLL